MSADNFLPSSESRLLSAREPLGDVSKTTDFGILNSQTIVGVPEPGDQGGSPSSQGASGKPLPGSLIGKYEVRSLLGQGGMGVVYAAFDPLIEREVALKLLSRDLLGTPTALLRFLGEAKAIGRLNHPHVVSIFDIGVWQDQHFIVMELLSGGSVADKQTGEEALPWQEACRIVIQAALGLEAAHQEGLIHRDIKPENLMLNKSGMVKVVDFGLSKLLDAEPESQLAVTKVGQMMGTPHYMSPEQLECKAVDAGTDIYSLGATLFRLLTGRFPFHDATTIFAVLSAHMTQPPPKATDFVPDAPRQLDQIIARAMSKRREDRYRSAQEMADELTAVLHASAVSELSLRGASHDSVPRPEPLRTALVIEPSKLQATIIKDALTQAGLETITIATSLRDAQNCLSSSVPDVVISAQQLDDGLGLEFLAQLCRDPKLKSVPVVLLSSDVELNELANLGHCVGVVLAPKKCRPEEALRLIHASSSRYASLGPLSTQIDPASVQLALFTSSGRLPDSLMNIIRESQILDVEVHTSRADFEASGVALKLMCLTREPSLTQLVKKLVNHKDSPGLVVMLCEDHGHLRLLGAARQGVQCVAQLTFDAERLLRLSQACRT